MAKQMHTVQLRGYTTKKGYARLCEVLELLRKLGNAALEERKTASGRGLVWYADENGAVYARREQLRPPQWPSLYTQQMQLKHIRANDPAYDALDNHILSGVLRRLDKAMSAFFRRVKNGEKPGYPRYKGYGTFRTIELDTCAPAWLKWINEKRAVLTIKGLPAIEIRHKGRLPQLEWRPGKWSFRWLYP